MARFASQNPHYSHGVRDARAEFLGPNGQMVPALRHLEAQFEHGLLTPQDILAAKAGLHFTGTVQDDVGRDIDPSGRISVFDSELSALQHGWQPDEEALVVETLRTSTEKGRAYIEIVPEPLAKPWPGYDDVETERIVEIALSIGADLDAVVAYEKENRNDSAVIYALSNVEEEQKAVVVQA